MSRRHRFHLPTGTYHVMLRGNNGQPIFFSNEDRIRMCLFIQEGVERFGHRVHAFCFMNNHIHLALQVGEISISRIMQNLAFRYTRYINRKQGRVGHLFQGRFKSIIVDGERYLKELIRYIHLNPVRSGLVGYPVNYHWGSHRAYLQLDTFTWITVDYFLSKFGDDRKEAMSNYHEYISNGIGVKTGLNFEAGSNRGMLGDEQFVEKVLEKVEQTDKREIALSNLVEKICRKYGVTEAALCLPSKYRVESHARSILALLVRDMEKLTLEELGRFLHREPSGLSKLARRLEKRCQRSEETAEEMRELRRWILGLL